MATTMPYNRISACDSGWQVFPTTGEHPLAGETTPADNRPRAYAIPSAEGAAVHGRRHSAHLLRKLAGASAPVFCSFSDGPYLDIIHAEKATIDPHLTGRAVPAIPKRRTSLWTDSLPKLGPRRGISAQRRGLFFEDVRCTF